MAARRVLLLLIGMLFLSTLAAVLIPVRPPTTTSTTSTDSVEETAAEPPGRVVARTLTIGSGKPETVRARVGDSLTLRVRSGTPQEIEVAGFGELEFADRYAPASFSLALAEPGSHAVRVAESGRTFARVDVRPAGGRASSEPRRRAGRSAGTSRSR